MSAHTVNVILFLSLTLVLAVQAENEFYEDRSSAPTATEYMLLLEAAFRNNGVTKVPLIVNDVWPSGNYASGHPASVDMCV